MIEVIFHGRGGQGAFTAAKLLGAAVSLDGTCHSIAYPSFGPERRGAPIRAFVKIDDKKIGDRSEIKKADFVVYLDETLLDKNWEDELKEGGIVLLNSKLRSDDNRIKCIDASGIATEVLGRDIPNTVFVAMIAILSDAVSLNDVKRAVRDYMPAKLVEKNLEIVEKVNSEGFSPDLKSRSIFFAKENKYAMQVRRAGAIIAKLYFKEPSKDEFCHRTCFKAGHLMAKNCGWRVVRPVVDENKCTGCYRCYMACPDGCVFKVEGEKRIVAIDYDFCKGCSICAKECKFGAIEMASERGGE